MSNYYNRKNQYNRRDIADQLVDEEELRERKERRGRIRRRVVRIIVFFLIIFVSIGIFYYAYKVAYDVPVAPQDESTISFTIEPGAGRKTIENDLLNAGLIDDTTIFRLRELIYQADYKSGTYPLSRSYTSEKIIDILSGETY